MRKKKLLPAAAYLLPAARRNWKPSPYLPKRSLRGPQKWMRPRMPRPVKLQKRRHQRILLPLKLRKRKPEKWSQQMPQLLQKREAMRKQEMKLKRETPPEQETPPERKVPLKRQGQDYDPSSPEFFWGALYRELGLYADASSLITTEESGEIKVPRQTAQEFATGLFADYSDLPALPESLSSMIRYDEGWDAYFLSPGDRGLSAAELLTASLTEDGGYDMTARLYDVTDSSDICVYRFHLVPNAYADGITEPLFLYSVESMSLQE